MNGQEQEEYKKRVENLMKSLQPSIDEEKLYYEQLPIGSKFWVPCAGIESLKIESGHVGRVDTYAGNKQWDRGGWVSKEVAESDGVTITGSHGLCTDCSKITDES